MKHSKQSSGGTYCYAHEKAFIRLMPSEIAARLPDALAEKLSDYDYDVINDVANVYPGIQSREHALELLEQFGLGFFYDLLPRVLHIMYLAIDMKHTEEPAKRQRLQDELDALNGMIGSI